MSDSDTSIDYPLTPLSSDSWRSAGDRFRAQVRANGARRLAGRTDERGRVRFGGWDLQRLQGRRSASIPPLLGARGSEHTIEDPSNFWPRGRGEERARRPSIGRPAMSQQKDFILKIRMLQRREDPYLSAHVKTPHSSVHEDFNVSLCKTKKELLRPQTRIEPPRPLVHQLVRPPYRCADPVLAPSSDDGYTTSYEGDDEDEYSSTRDSSVEDDEDDETYYTAAEMEETYFTAPEW